MSHVLCKMHCAAHRCPCSTNQHFFFCSATQSFGARVPDYKIKPPACPVHRIWIVGMSMSHQILQKHERDGKQNGGRIESLSVSPHFS